MIKNFANRRVPLYAIAILLFILAGVGTFVFFRYLPGTIDNYKLYIPQANQAAQEFQYGSWPALANADFFNQVKDQFVTDKADFIDADLSAMKLTVYSNGAPIKEFPILTKGRPGSWWETPAGLYKIEDRQKSHFSAFAGVYMPWSMPFQGNFFIHGWPYYPDGTPVSTQYSGGCIRLSTEDAGQLFQMVKVGMPVLVYADDFASDDFQYQMNTPQFAGDSYLAADLSSSFVFADKNASAQMPIASITKLMTALVAVEYVNIENEMTVPQSALIPTSKARLTAGEKISLYNLLPLLLMESSNEAAETIANYMGRTYFISLMNQKAAAIGMQNTHFVDPAGREDGNVSTAQDLFALAKYLYHNRSFILKMTRGDIDNRAYGPLMYPDVASFNGFTDDPDYVGGKVGLTTAAGETILSIFNIKAADNSTRPVALILLHTPDEFGETSQMLDWIKTNYH